MCFDSVKIILYECMCVCACVCVYVRLYVCVCVYMQVSECYMHHTKCYVYVKAFCLRLCHLKPTTRTQHPYNTEPPAHFTLMQKHKDIVHARMYSPNIIVHRLEEKLVIRSI